MYYVLTFEFFYFIYFLFTIEAYIRIWLECNSKVVYADGVNSIVVWRDSKMAR